MRAHSLGLFILFVSVIGCRSIAPPIIRFAPPGTDRTRLHQDFPLTDAERLSVTPDNLKALTQAQIDEIYERLTAGPLADGPFRGDLFFPRDRDHDARIRDVADPLPGGALANIALLRVEDLGRALWKGKVFFRSQRILRNRIEDLAILKLFFPDSGTIPKLTFDGETTWLLFPAAVSCGESRLDPSRPSIVIDYTKGPEIEGYRPVPDKLAGPDGLNIRNEIRLVRPGFYLGRAYFGTKFGLNFTLIDPMTMAAPPAAGSIREDCQP